MNFGGDRVGPAFRVTARQTGSNTLRLTWLANSGKAYNILGSPVVTGDYYFVQTVSSTSDSAISVNLPLSGKASFFIVQEAL